MTGMDIDALADAVADRLAERLALPDDRPLLSPKNLAERLGVSERSARWMLSDGRIPFVKIGESVKIKPGDVDAYIERLAQAE